MTSLTIMVLCGRGGGGGGSVAIHLWCVFIVGRAICDDNDDGHHHRNSSGFMAMPPYSCHIHNVIPPDEYVVNYHGGGVNDSVYTNTIAALSLHYATLAAAAIALGEGGGGKGEEVKVDPQWSKVANGLVVLVDDNKGIHPEYDGYEGQMVKQADAILLGYPLGVLGGGGGGGGVRERDLDYYSARTDPSGPAMSWAMYAIGYLEAGRVDEAHKYLNRSFMDYITQPFGVWSEMPVTSEVTKDGSNTNFITGGGGFLQAVVMGYGGLRLEQQWLRISPMCFEGATHVKMRQLAYR